MINNHGLHEDFGSGCSDYIRTRRLFNFRIRAKLTDPAEQPPLVAGRGSQVSLYSALLDTLLFLLSSPREVDSPARHRLLTTG